MNTFKPGKNVFTAISVVVSVLALFSGGDLTAQKKRPPQTKKTVQDSINAAKQDSLEEEKALPKLNLREYTITGRERLRVLPSDRNPVLMTDFARSVQVSVLQGQQNRVAPGAGGPKFGRDFSSPIGGSVNEVYASFGKYSDINAGVKYRKKFEDRELFTDLNIKNTEGHVDFAEYFSLNGSIADIRPIAQDIQNRFQVMFNTQRYKFYGSQVNPEAKRSGYYVDVSNTTDIMRFEPVQISLDVGGRYFDPDDTEYFNWDLWSKLNMRAVAGSSFITGSVLITTDRVKDGGSDNAPISDANYVRAQLSFERLLTPRLHLKAGASYYNTMSENASPLFENVDGSLIVTGPHLVEKKTSEVYPQVAITYDMGDQGRFFAEYDPRIDPFNLLEKLMYNQYLSITTPLAYEKVSQSLKFGWRRSYTHDLSFEIFYNDRSIEDFGILLDTNQAMGGTPSGSWGFMYGNRVDVNEYKATLSWNPHIRFGAWTSLSYSDYNVRESTFADRLPYVPELVSEISVSFIPGWATQIILDGRYVGERETMPFDTDIEQTELDSYFLANITIDKQWNRQVSSYIYLYNIFNQEYELWQGYFAPDFVGGAGFRFFW